MKIKVLLSRIFNRWTYAWKQRRVMKRVRAGLYPVVIEQSPSGKQLVLVRSLETHQYGGWLCELDTAVEEFGPMAKKLPIIPSELMQIEYTTKGFEFIGHAQRAGYSREKERGSAQKTT